ncbi:MerR family transcriptional regulator [Nocardia sp. NPDC058497]|uniref:MerR family transcriptional regulator n=1 Tax=Nocardia sp. NPDC058497 TaxID=3346529 RepID=UPI00364EE4DE
MGRVQRSKVSATYEWSIKELSKQAGVTSRTLRHYAHIGLLEPSRTGPNGLRFYDAERVLVLHRILVLRHLGTDLNTIKEALAAEPVVMESTLRRQLDLLGAERSRIDRQINAVEGAMRRLRSGEYLDITAMFDGLTTEVA